MRRSIALLAVGLAVAGGFVAGRVGTAGATPDAVLARSFAAAFADADTAWATTPANVWLSNLGGPAPAFGKTLSVGDVVTMGGKDGRPQTIEVTALEQVDGSRIGLAGVSFQLVTGRQTVYGAEHMVRFLFAVDGGSNAPTQRPAGDRVL